MGNIISKNTQNIALIALPIVLIALIKKDEGLKLNMSFSTDYEDKAKLIKEIKPYFLEEDQHILGRAQDIFEILSKAKRIISNDYNNNIKLASNISIIDRKDKILSEVANYMDNDKKRIANAVINTKNNMIKAKENIDTYSQKSSTQNTDRLSSMVNLVNCIEPIMPDRGKIHMRKLEQIANIIKSSDDNLKPLY